MIGSVIVPMASQATSHNSTDVAILVWTALLIVLVPFFAAFTRRHPGKLHGALIVYAVFGATSAVVFLQFWR